MNRSHLGDDAPSHSCSDAAWTAAVLSELEKSGGVLSLDDDDRLMVHSANMDSELLELLRDERELLVAVTVRAERHVDALRQLAETVPTSSDDLNDANPY